jgi:hypothetical protein
MYCPKCRSEYVEGILECTDCRIPLVETLPVEHRVYPRPAHRIVTLLAITSTSYFFVLRTAGTLVPDFFANLAVARITAVLSLLAGLTFVLFYITLLRVYVGREKDRLQSATALAVFASALLTLLHIKGLSIVFHERAAVYLSGSRFLDAAEAVTPWLGSLLMLYFFVTLYGVLVHKKMEKLRKAALAAIVGSSVGVLLQSFILMLYTNSKAVKWYFDLPRRTAIAFFPAVFVGFILVVYFYVSFYKEQKRAGRDLVL